MGLTIAPLPAPRTGAALRAAVLEAAVLTGHLLLYPTGIREERPAAQPAARTAGQLPPVLLLHGFTDNRSVFVLLRRALGAGGRRRVETYNYSPFTRDLRVTARHLARRVEELCERTGQDRVDLVGHSLGGLVARYHVQRLGGDARVRTLVTLGTPHGGTRVAPFMDAHPLVRQMRPDSDVMAELRAPAPGCRTRCVAFWSEFDALMTPTGTARIEHPDLEATNIQVTGIGHLALPVHPAVITAVRRALDGPVSATDHAVGATDGATDSTARPGAGAGPRATGTEGRTRVV
ncbi:triacylglycerol lipase [Streptomyces sp. NBC_00091]|uniref:esterase/lipase family protein n=1 Tax=Streptomyces sp. NBC_00091 TaxID=2975648 RepID=UPI00225A8D90|nr:alpha/beta fold hydrolase [Streptomyces sp. NBC_00091]MCX5376412.1 alpha/beta fold hydrolase [Streptomyces sp. NBC_00091]